MEEERPELLQRYAKSIEHIMREQLVEQVSFRTILGLF